MATAGNTVNKIQKFSYTNANNTTVYNSDLTVKGNLTVVGASVYAQTEVVLVKDNIITLNAAIGQSDTPLFNAGIEVDRGNQPNVALIWNESTQAWQFTNNGSTYESLGGGSSGVYANSAFSYANGAYAHANAAFISANNVAPQVQPAFDRANAAYAFANSSSAWGTRQAFVATAGQTAFSPGSGYLPGYIDVYYNGLKLYGAEDYTATDGINVTLTNPAPVNTVIEIVGFGANVPAANIYVLNSMASLLNRQTFFATSGQTTFTTTQSYRVGYVDVYYNGLKMNIPEDVTANNGTTVNFIGLTPTTNDVIEIVGLTPNVALANAIPITGGTISGGINLAGNVNPTTDNTYYLGSSTNRWHTLFVGPGSIDIGGLKLSNVGGVLSVSSPGAPATPIAGEDTWVRAQANASFIKANTPSDIANSAAIYANGAFAKANSGVQYDANNTSTGFFTLPIGTLAQRPPNPARGTMRYNSSNNVVEVYMPSAGWVNIAQDTFTLEYLIVAGGGGGGTWAGGGGGGAGGVLYSATLNTPIGVTYTVTVGSGGSAGASSPNGPAGGNGSNSSLVASAINVSYIGIGGGAGGGAASPGGVQGGQPGGSGGGSGGSSGPVGTGTIGQGNAGGAYGVGQAWGGGGGGAGAVGSAATTGGGPGGIGVTYAAFNTYSPSGYFGGGGGGAAHTSGTTGVGGTGGGGDGYYDVNAQAPSGLTNSGGGGGGAGGRSPSYGVASGGGGSGIVIIRYAGTTQRATGGTITSASGYTYHAFTGSGTFNFTG